MIRLAQPHFLWLLLPLAVLAWWLWQRKGGGRPRMKYSSVGLLAGAGAPTLRTRLLGFPLVLLFLASILTVVAMARPQSFWSQRQRFTEGIDIMLVIDASESMKTDDLTPNRLEKAKEVIGKFIQGRTEDQIGIVIFGAETFTLCPLTQDYAALETFVDRLDFDLVDGSKTALGMGLANGVNRLRKSKAKSKVAIALTDGVNNAGRIDPLTAAGIAKEFDIRVYTIGVGSSEDYRKTVRSPLTGLSRVVRVRPQLDEKQLKQIAEMTGGQYFRATDDQSLETIYEQIDLLEKTEIEISETHYFDELAHWFALVALGGLIVAFLLEQTWLRTFP